MKEVQIAISEEILNVLMNRASVEGKTLDSLIVEILTREVDRQWLQDFDNLTESHSTSANKFVWRRDESYE